MYLNDAEQLVTDNAIRHMLSTAERWHFASTQDTNPIISARHNGYAIAVLDVLLNLASRERITKVSGKDPRLLRKDIIALQDRYSDFGLKAAKWLEGKGYTLDKLIKKIEAL